MEQALKTKIDSADETGDVTTVDKTRRTLAGIWRNKVGEPVSLEATQGQILTQSPTDATRFWWHLYGSCLKKPSICPWVASRSGESCFAERKLL